jgi:hypothetical protein
MITDDLFFSEKKPLRKAALAITIPCGILPILMSVYGLINLPFAPLLFRYDYILYLFIICLYVYGLFISYQNHKKILPFLMFILSMGSICYFIFFSNLDFLVPVAIISILLTSLTNQYFRTEPTDCMACSSSM